MRKCVFQSSDYQYDLGQVSQTVALLCHGCIGRCREIIEECDSLENGSADLALGIANEVRNVLDDMNAALHDLVAAYIVAKVRNGSWRRFGSGDQALAIPKEKLVQRIEDPDAACLIGLEDSNGITAIRTSLVLNSELYEKVCIGRLGETWDVRFLLAGPESEHSEAAKELLGL